MIIYITAEQLPGNGFPIKHDWILLPFVVELNYNPFLHSSDRYFCHTYSDPDDLYVDLEQPSVRTHIYGAPDLDSNVTGKRLSNEYFNIFDSGIDLWLPLLGQEKYRLAQWCVTHHWSSASVNEQFRIPTMATISNSTSSHTLIKRLNGMPCAMCIDCWTSGGVWYKHFADSNNLCNNDYKHFFYRNFVECIEFHK